MKHPNFTFTLDRTYSDGVDYRELDRLRKSGKRLDAQCYYSKETGIYVSWNYGGKYYKEYAGVKILPVMWDWRSKLPLKKHAGYLELSTLLNTILSKIQKEYLWMRTEHLSLTGASIREMVKTIIHGDHSTPDKGQLWKVFDEFIEEKKLLAAASTVVKYHNLRRHLQAFEKAKGENLTFDIINMRWYNEFMVYCIGQGFLTNTTGKLIAMMKAFMNYAYDRKFTRNLEFKKFKVKSETTEPIFLTMEELRAIERYDPAGNNSLAISRDVFLIGCFTGQRISDLMGMKRKDLKTANGDVWWEVHQVKTRKRVRIFVINKARKILEKYLIINNPDGYVFPRISPVIINRNLKIIGKEAGLTAEITKVNYCGNKKKEITQPKYKLLTTHVARKTFITALCASKMPDHEIQRMSGHSSSKELKIYKGHDAGGIRSHLIALFEPVSIVKSA